MAAHVSGHHNSDLYISDEKQKQNRPSSYLNRIFMKLSIGHSNYIVSDLGLASLPGAH